MDVTNKPITNAATDYRNIVNEYFGLIGAGKFKDGLRFFAPDSKTHNPYIAGSVETLTNAMIGANKDMSAQLSQPEFTVKHLLVDGNIVAAHTQLLNSKSNPEKGGLRQVHLFRFEGDKIVEYWDITQQILPSMPNAGGAF
jgi:predicted SnoaL-like aldol condensation-catalyzing enzyme